ARHDRRPGTHAEDVVRDARLREGRQGRLLLPRRGEVQGAVRNVRLQRHGEPRRGLHVADRLRADEADSRGREADRSAREASGELIPHAYRALLRDPSARRLLSGLGVSSLGDGMSIVTIAWLAVRTAPAGELGLFVGLAVAAYALPGAVGALALGRYLRHRPARALVLFNCVLRAGFLRAIVVLCASGALSSAAYVALLAGSSLLASWGSAGQYTMLAEIGGEEGRLAANSLAAAQVWLATIVGPVLAGLLLSRIAPGWLLAFDAGSFAF